LTSQLTKRLHAAIERQFPERRLFIKSGDHTRFVRLGPKVQLMAWMASGMFVAWAIVVTSILLMDSIGSGNYRDQAMRELMIYEDRISALSGERDLRREEAITAQERSAAALRQVSLMQSEILAAEERRREFQTRLEVMQANLRRTVAEREDANERLAGLQASKGGGDGSGAEVVTGTLDLMIAALAETARERDRLAAEAGDAVARADELDLELRLMEERNDAIFGQLEDALTISVEPLDDMFRAAGLDPEELINDVQRGHSDGSEPLMQIQMSTMGVASSSEGTLRANRILDQLDRINDYSLAIERVPLAMPVQDDFRYTSGFGPRWGRMHEGVDMAAPIGTPIYVTADGVVTFAGWQNGYGRIIKVQHEFGIETRYPHLNAIRVEVGQTVARGERIGDMGNSGRSTGSHLHYEVRVNGEAIDPMIYIRAGQEAL
jgi:murein DD-endopeptidase MepM/ murein hydrolase activator NlpD